MSIMARLDQHRDESRGQPCRDHPPGLCPAPKRSPAGALCPYKRGDPAFPPLPWPWCHLLPPLLLVGQHPLAPGRGRYRAGRPTPRAPKPALVEQRLCRWLPWSFPWFFFFFWKEVSSFLPVSISSRLLPAHASTNNQKPYHLLKATVDWPQKGLATSSTGLAVDSCSVSQYALSAPGSRNVKATC